METGIERGGGREGERGRLVFADSDFLSSSLPPYLPPHFTERETETETDTDTGTQIGAKTDRDTERHALVSYMQMYSFVRVAYSC